MPGPVGKAMVLHEHGADKLTLVQDFPFAEPKAGEVLVKVVAAGVNPVDGYVRAGTYASPSFPLIIGGDLSGTVVSAGEGSRFKAGDAVFGVSSTYISKAPELQGTYASHCVLKDEWLAAAPKSIPLAHAAAAPLAAPNAGGSRGRQAHRQPPRRARGQVRSGRCRPDPRGRAGADRI